ncbi:MAG: type II secretion system protein [Candidatus Omnitrophica bacterium]|nr:type II secretion system protein [Candidatus Omnitrophota bacterium]
MRALYLVWRLPAGAAPSRHPTGGSGFGAKKFWILDFRFWIGDWAARLALRESKIENLKSKIRSAPTPEHTGVVQRPARRLAGIPGAGVGNALRRGPVVAFTLVELLIVVAIIIMLAAVGFSQVARSRMVAREELALEHMKAISKACQMFFVAHRRFPAKLSELGLPVSDPPYLDLSLTRDPAVRQGYRLTYRRPEPDEFLLKADPIQHGATGIRHFVTDETLHMYYTDEDRDAVPGSDPAW